MTVISLLLYEYVFGFQRQTLRAARLVSEHIDAVGNVAQLQLLMTPAAMGALGWLTNLSLIASAILLWSTFGWQRAVGYAIVWVVLPACVPDLPLKKHYGNLAARELRKRRSNLYGADELRILDALQWAVTSTDYYLA